MDFDFTVSQDVNGTSPNVNLARPPPRFRSLPAPSKIAFSELLCATNRLTVWPSPTRKERNCDAD